MDDLTPEQRRKNMQAIKSKDTSIEIALRKALWNQGIRYRKNYKALPGKPDIAITKYKIAVFCDSDYWHGYDWENRSQRIKSNRDYWIPKIERNMKRKIQKIMISKKQMQIEIVSLKHRQRRKKTFQKK